MGELLINTNNHKLGFLLVCWFFYIFCTFFHFLGNGYSQNAAIVFLVILILLITLNWYVFQSSKRKVLIKKEENLITVYETKFFGEKVSKAFLIKNFTAVRSFIESSNGIGINYVELVSIDGENNLILSSFNPSSSYKFLSSLEYENIEAANLRNCVSEFTGLINLGFFGTSYNRL